MTDHNLGSSIDYGARFERSDLDGRLEHVLEWLDDTGHGLGEIIDRLQHLAAMRTHRKCTGRDLFQINDGDAEKVMREMRRNGMKYQDIAKKMNCSVGYVHGIVHAHDFIRR